MLAFSEFDEKGDRQENIKYKISYYRCLALAL
jgi:hypothetical protein